MATLQIPRRSKIQVSRGVKKMAKCQEEKLKFKFKRSPKKTTKFKYQASQIPRRRRRVVVRHPQQK
jgi:hypothetical protein